MLKKPKFYDLFCGIGGFRLGLERNGFKCIGSCEIDKYAREVYKKNFGEYPTERDVRQVDIRGLPDFDILTGGFPCQSFSVAGSGKGFGDTRGNLFFEILHIIREKRPQIVFLENVKGLLSNDSGRTFGRILYEMDELGYDVEWQVINGRYFVPQKRERVFIIGHSREKPTKKIFPLGKEVTDNQTKDIIKEGQKHEIVNCICHNYWKGVDNHGQRTVVAIPTKFLNRNQSVMESEIFPTLDTLEGHGIFDGHDYRMLTPLECERLMGFPDNWTEGQNDTERYKMLGNAVIPQIIETISKDLMYFL